MDSSGKKVLLVTAAAVTLIGATLIAQDAANVKGNKKADVQDVLLNDFETWVCTIAMLLGRIEMFAVLLLFTRGFWRA